MTHLLILLPIHLLIHLPILLPILLQVDGRKGRGTEGAERERMRREVMSSGGKGASLTGEKSQQRQAPITPTFLTRSPREWGREVYLCGMLCNRVVCLSDRLVFLRLADCWRANTDCIA